jgi:hypothetical protein
MGCRKNQATLTTAEKTAFVNALLALKNNVPSRMGLTNRYDDYVQTHMNAMMASPGWGHQLPAFVPWHRELLRHFELDLQAIDPSVTIPYWDWTVAQDPNGPNSPFTADFLGGDGDPAQNFTVTTGAFAAANGKWPLAVQSDGFNVLRRQFGVNAPTLPSPAQLNVALADATYDVAPFTRSSASGFRNHLEGWIASGNGPNDAPPQNHNRVHVWCGGTMLPMTSPNDPVFWLNHCNIDRQWGIWQAMHPMSAPYLPVSGAPLGQNLNDNMIFFDVGPAPWTDTATPASVINHHLLGYSYDSDPVQIALLTPSIAFSNIPEGIGGTGITTYRPIKFAVQSCGNVRLEITAGPTPGFNAPSLFVIVNPDAQVPAGLQPGQGRLWIAYTSTVAGASITGSVTVRATNLSSGVVFGPWVVNLSANTVARPKSAVTLVLDRSGSMSTDAGNGTARVDLLRGAVGTFIDVMQQGDGLGIVRFDNLVDTLMPVTDVGAMPGGAGRIQAQNIVTTHDPASTLDPRGSTSIGGGILAGKATLDAVAGTFPNRAMIVLTDGLENTPPMIADVASSLTDHTFAIGFGQAAAISTAALNAITENHGGYLVVTGPITPDETFALTEYFLKIQAGIGNSSAVLDPRGELVFGAVHRIPFTLIKADMGIDAILLSPAPYAIDFALQAPDGTIINPARAAGEPAMRFVSTSRVSYYRASLPMLAAAPAGSHAGQWYVLLRLSDKARDNPRGVRNGSLPYSLLLQAYSNITFVPRLLQTSFAPGATVQVIVKLDQYGVPLERPASVWADITSPDGSSATVTLAQLSPGRFAGSFVATSTGVYTARVQARGITWEGQSFQREQRLTAVVFPGGDTPVPRPQGESPLCELLRCLLSSGALSKEMEAMGINPAALRKCLEETCRPDASQLGGERPYDPAARHVPVMIQPVDRAQLREAVLEVQQEAAAQAGQVAELVEGQPVVHPAPEPMIMNFGLQLDNPPQDDRPAPRQGRRRRPRNQ